VNVTRNSPAVIASLACAALLCAVPFLQPFHTAPLTSFYNESLAVGLGLGVMTVLLERKAWESAEVPWVALMPFGLALLLLLHGVLGWAPYFGQALMGALYLAWAGVLIVAVRALTRLCGFGAVSTVIAGGLVAGALLNAFIGVVQHFGLTTPLDGYIVRPQSMAIFGNMGQPNHYAAYVTLGLFGLAFLHGRGRFGWMATAVLAAPMLFVLGLSGSRSVWLYLLTAFVLAAWLKASNKSSQEGRRLFMVCGAAIIVHSAIQGMVGAGWLRPASRESVTAIERLFSGAASLTERFEVWQAAWRIAWESPLLGIGWGAFAAHFYEHAASRGMSAGLFNNAHNIVLHLFAETGLIGVAALCVPLLIWLLPQLRQTRDSGQWWLWAALAVIAIHSCLEYPLWYAYFMGIAALLLGLAPATGFVPRLARRGRMFAVAVIGIGAFNTLFLWMDYRELEGLYLVTVKQERKIDMTDTVLRLHRNTLLTPYVELVGAYSLAVEEQNLVWRRQLVDRVVRFNPLPALLYRQVLLLAMSQRSDEARARLQLAQRAHPVPPPGFDAELARLARLHPERFAPLLEFRTRHAAGRS